MSGKVIITKQFHRKALRAIEKCERLESLQDESMETIRLAWMSFMERHCDDELLDKFTEYCEEYKKELGLEDL